METGKSRSRKVSRSLCQNVILVYCPERSLLYDHSIIFFFRTNRTAYSDYHKKIVIFTFMRSPNKQLIG